MNEFQKQIKESMSSVENVNGKLTAKFRFSAGFAGFKGHFPDNPVLPGMCMIQAILVMLKSYEGKTVCMKQIVQAKFFKTVSCDEECVFELSEHAADNGNKLVKARVRSREEKVARIELIVGESNMETK
jgi:3-hydroxymyristoyl/3-hydroxydecanoyl-(acyl carrier protein) dehydratase